MKSVQSCFRLITSICLLLIGTLSIIAASSPPGPKFGPKWKELVGEWKGENESGVPSGACGFHFDLSEHVIIRTNHAELSGASRPHDDLMVVSPDQAPDKAKAVYSITKAIPSSTPENGLRMETRLRSSANPRPARSFD